MTWYYKSLGGHTHVRVYMNGAKCGDLCFRNDEFESIQRAIVCTDTMHKAAIGVSLITFKKDPV